MVKDITYHTCHLGWLAAHTQQQEYPGSVCVCVCALPFVLCCLLPGFEQKQEEQSVGATNGEGKVF